MHVAAPLSVVIMLVVQSTPCFAGPQDVSPELRQQAIQSCTNDAVRLCPAALMDEGETVSCMSGKRLQLTKSCRVVYDQVARLLKQ